MRGGYDEAEVIAVSSDSEEQIAKKTLTKTAYHKQALKLHSDKNAGSETKQIFQKLHHAFE